MKQTFPLTRDLVLVGGGHTHALVLRMWGMQPLPGVRLTVINPGPTAPYSGMLPGFVAGHYGRDDLDIDLVRLCGFAGARIIDGAVTAIDTGSKTVTVPGWPPVGYDILSLDVGITSAMPDLPGFNVHGIPAKPLGTFARKWDAYRTTTQDAQVAVIGGGVAGAELAMAMGHALRKRGTPAVIHLVDRGKVLDGFTGTARRLLLAGLAENGVTLVEDARVAQVDATTVHLADGRLIPSTFTVGAAGAKPYDWLGQTGLVLHHGFVAVDAHLRSSHPTIFAVGDCAHLAHAPRPKAGVFAVRAAPVLFDNLRAVLSGGALRPFHPQRDYLKLVSLGGKSALAEKFGTARRGALLWRWKDRIDRTFMNKFRDYPEMPAPELPETMADGLRDLLGTAPMCAGCGSKVGRGVLQDAVTGTLPFDDAAILQSGPVTQVISTDHLRAFTDDPVVFARIAALHALGDIWAMGGRPQVALATVILPRMSTDLQRRTMAEIMAAATEVVENAGARIVGGHTTMGAEASIGFTVTGLCDAPPITLAGAVAGDVLILTKPIGSGTILAAQMRGLAKGADVQAALAWMMQGQGAASALLAGAHAMTDVTGFGLAGHLAGICEASDITAEIDLSAVPLMPGAIDLAGAGVRSTLYPDNRAGAGPVFGAAGARGDLLFDPQTAGGLLAAVAAQDADSTVAALVQAGYPAVVIGRFVPGPAQIKVV